ncbi:Uncharacterised protein [Segatella copri]|nr:Uncharacterised protein [Segatella copri]
MQDSSCQMSQLQVYLPVPYFWEASNLGSTTSYGMVVSTRGFKSEPTVMVRQGVEPGRMKVPDVEPMPSASFSIGKAI